LLHLFLRVMSQKRQSISCSLFHASLEHPPQCGSFDHMVDAVNMIGYRPLIDDHTHMPKIRVPAKQPRDADEKWGSLYPSARSSVHRVFRKWPTY
jgi:hypothetical protein